jgi:hypothetical protein
MSHRSFYNYEHRGTARYTFTSVGRRSINNVVDFTHTGIKNIVMMGFGDLRSDGSVDDIVNSNNGDIVKVLSTIVQIIMDFTTLFPDTEIFFTGSTPERNKLYVRIMRSYYGTFSKQFIINVLVKDGMDYQERAFSPEYKAEVAGFFIKRIA